MSHSHLHSKEVTTAQVSAVSFGFFSDEEVRAVGTITHAIYMACMSLPCQCGCARGGACI
jgi:hypothetical protein